MKYIFTITPDEPTERKIFVYDDIKNAVNNFKNFLERIKSKYELKQEEGSIKSFMDNDNETEIVFCAYTKDKNITIKLTKEKNYQEYYVFDFFQEECDISSYEWDISYIVFPKGTSKKTRKMLLEKFNDVTFTDEVTGKYDNVDTMVIYIATDIDYFDHPVWACLNNDIAVFRSIEEKFNENY